MTKAEFAEVIGFLELSTGKPIHPDPKVGLERTRLYFQMLGDLPLWALREAAEQLVREREWPTFPQVAELRKIAATFLDGRTSELSAAEAWEIAWRAAGQLDLEVPHTVQKVNETTPPLVLEAMRAFGLPALCYGREPVGVVRGQFTKIYEQLLARDKRDRLLPGPAKERIEARGVPHPAIAGVVNQIGNPEAP